MHPGQVKISLIAHDLVIKVVFHGPQLLCGNI